MKRVKGLGRYQKGVLLFMMIMVLVFTILYPVTISREGFAYKNAILVPHPEDGGTVYSGKIQGRQADFTVLADKTVYFQYDGKTYGPYTAREDASAIPKESELRDGMVGVELRRGEEILFRGGVLDYGDSFFLYGEDGRLKSSYLAEIPNDETVMDEMEPSVPFILDLMGDPALTHKGDWLLWLAGVFICIFTAISILFADELFRWNLAFQIRDAQRAEPSDWEIATRYISWTVLPIVAMVVFIAGLQ